MPEIVTIGEIMVMFSPDQSGPLRYVNNFCKRIAGAESNVAISVVRMGHSSGWISKLGNDEFGKYVLREMRSEGVDVSQVKTCPEAPTGIMFKEKWEGRETKVYYYRKDSAASRMAPDDLDSAYISSAKILHLTGITLALSSSCREMAFRAASIAREHNVIVSFDPNIRLKLWNKEQAREGIQEMLPYVDIVLPGMDEGQIIFGKTAPDELAEAFLDAGAKVVALKMGKEGCLVADRDARYQVEPFCVEKVVDPIGAGDAFAAGFLTGYLESKSLYDCGQLANAAGAFAVGTIGDYEGLPSRYELDAFIRNEMGIDR